jgi:preprotein translocase SecE subunit
MARSSLRDIVSRPNRSAAVRGSRRGGIVQFFNETIAELKKTVWLSRPEVARLTFIVIVISGIVGTFLWVLDLSMTQTFTRFIIR